MPKKRWIDKKSATTFALVHRPQNDPRIHDEDASSMVFAQVSAPKDSQSHRFDDTLAEKGEYGFDPRAVRSNEGEAAMHGIFYDDTSYDYMQHMRDLSGARVEEEEEYSGGGGVFLEADDDIKEKKQDLADALREVSLSNEAGPSSSSTVLGKRSRPAPGAPLLDSDVFPQPQTFQQRIQAQQDVPDDIAGFQPDMDPRLREVLTALDDEAYVDEEEDGDLFAELAGTGEELNIDEFEHFAGPAPYDDDDMYEDMDDEEDEGAESDSTEKGANKAGKSDWMAEYKAFKADAKAGVAPRSGGVKFAAGAAPSITSMQTTSTYGPRRKKRKGALTDTSSYSMTSSSLFRTDAQTTLDSRFDKIEEEYNSDGSEGYSESVQLDDAASSIAPSLVSTTSRASKYSRAAEIQDATPANFDSMLDEFLGNTGMAASGKSKRSIAHASIGKKTGMEQLDELRKGLGPPILKSKVKGKTKKV